MGSASLRSRERVRLRRHHSLIRVGVSFLVFGQHPTHPSGVLLIPLARRLALLVAPMIAEDVTQGTGAI